MFLFFRPDESRIRTILAGQRTKDFSYPEVGASRGDLPAGYAVLRDRVGLGRGATTFDRAVQALRQWKMFAVPGIQLCWPAPIQPGEAVAVVITHFGFWSINCCRIVYVVDEDGPVQRFGFAYGTLPEHAEKGEERFCLEWDRASDLVGYDILSFSRPGNFAVGAAFPLARWLQRKFLQRSLAVVAECVQQK